MLSQFITILLGSAVGVAAAVMALASTWNVNAATKGNLIKKGATGLFFSGLLLLAGIAITYKFFSKRFMTFSITSLIVFSVACFAYAIIWVRKTNK